jgi:hypothetical protein
MSYGRISTPNATMDILDLYSPLSLAAMVITMILGSSIVALFVWMITRARGYMIGYWNIVLALYLPSQILALGSLYLEMEGIVPKGSFLPEEFTAEIIRLQIVLNIGMIVVQSILLFVLAPDHRYGPLSPIRWMGIILSSYALIILIALATGFVYAAITTDAGAQTAGLTAPLTEKSLNHAK